MKRLMNLKQLMKWLAPLSVTLMITGSAHAAAPSRTVVKRHQTIIYYPAADQSYAQPKVRLSSSPPAVQMVPLPPRDTTNTTPINHQPRPRRPMNVTGTILLPPPHTVMTHPYLRPPGVLPTVQERVSSSPARYRVSSYRHHSAARRHRTRRSSHRTSYPSARSYSTRRIHTSY